MNISVIIYLSFQNYFRHIRRYMFILVSLTIAISAFIAVLGFILGMHESVYDKASRYFSGDIIVQSYNEGFMLNNIENVEHLETLTMSRLSQVKSMVKRSLYLHNSQLFFNGKYLNQRRIIGVDWKNEEDIMSGFSFINGAVPEEDDYNAILVSYTTADYLGLKLGDKVLLNGGTDAGSQNTHSFIVKGIFTEGSFFNYASYVHRSTLNNFAGRSSHFVNEVGIILNNPNTKRQRLRMAEKLQKVLQTSYTVLPVIRNKEDRAFYFDSQENIPHSTIALLPLDTQLAEISSLLNVFSFIAFAVLFLFVILIIVGISNTFSVIVIERKRESGTMRVLGMSKHNVFSMFLVESIFLGITGCFFGFLIGILFLTMGDGIIGTRYAGSLSLFTRNGNLQWELPAYLCMFTIVLGIIPCIIGCVQVAYRISRLAPIKTLEERT